MKKNLLSVQILMLGLLLCFRALGIAQESNNFEISKNLEIYTDLMRQLNLSYADDIKPGELTNIAIDAMLEHLDPYTVYVPESRREDFELMTKGEYGGIGALIQQQGDYVIISEPYEGFPAQKAGLKAGDAIFAIDGESAKGKNTVEVSDRLKGVPGSTLTLEIKHFGDTLTKEYVLERERIKIPNIPYSGFVAPGTGYISLSQFNQSAALDVKNALQELMKGDSLTGLILDLRGNGGGLLNEAVDIVNLFVGKGEVVVTTKGKTKASTNIHKTRNKELDAKLPLVVLVDGNSASASEIVAGSIQDMDRGVIMGEQTFGKGLVQNIMSLPYNSKVKITVAKYYIPSGRCIQAIDYFNNDSAKADSGDSAAVASFYTRHGRRVYEGLGIAPDVETTQRVFSQVSGDLYAQNVIFDFVNSYVMNHDSILPVKKFVVTDSLYNAFKSYVGDRSFNYHTETESLIAQLEASAGRESYLVAIQPQLDTLRVMVIQEKKNDMDKHRAEIEEMLKMEIITRYYYQTGKIEAALSTDPEVTEAATLLHDMKRYNQILSGNTGLRK